MLKQLTNSTLDGLMFVVPILELSGVMALIPPEYLPVYMLAITGLRRLVRILEEAKKQ